MMKVDLRLYAILDPERSMGRDLATLADAVTNGGATLLQYRDKHADTRTLVARARAIMAAVAGRIPVLINDRIDVALASGADGVHIGNSDMLPPDARALLGPDKIIGITLKRSADLADLTPKIVNYGCIGGIFSTSSKHNPTPPLGLDGLTRLHQEATKSGLPIGAIAGIDASNATAVITAGADGVAIISALFMQPDVAAAARDLRTIVDAALDTRGI